MDELRDRARLVDASTFEGRGITATVPRAEIEGVVRSADGPAELELDVARRDDGEIEAHTFRMEWDRQELEELLRNIASDKVTLVLDSAELERAMSAEVEAHGIRETAAVFAVAAATAAAGAGHAAASPIAVIDSGGAGSAAPIEMVSDAASGGASGQSAVALQSAAQSDAQMLRDAAASRSAQGPELVSDAASSGPGTTLSAQPAEMVSDAASSGPVTAASAQPPEMVSDAASSGPATQAAEATSGGGFSISAPDAATGGLIAGGAALLITAAGFVVRGQRRQVSQPT
jgi:hypothetical protein